VTSRNEAATGPMGWFMKDERVLLVGSVMRPVTHCERCVNQAV
jgi:hypothetical protein